MGFVPKALIKIDTDRLGRCLLMDENNVAIEMRTLWSERPAIVVFLRHFACVACRAHAEQVWKDRAKFEKDGARFVFIGNGTPSYVMRFKEELGVPDLPIYTDPSLNAFAAAGFRRGFLASLGARSLGNMGAMIIKGAKPKLPNEETGDLWQLGGILVIRKDGTVPYQYISEAVGDFPPEKDEPDLTDSDDVATVTG